MCKHFYSNPRLFNKRDCIKAYTLHRYLAGKVYFPKIFAPNIIVKRNRTMKIKNNTFAIEAAPAAIPVKPNIAAIIAITTKITAHLSMIINF